MSGLTEQQRDELRAAFPNAVELEHAYIANVVARMLADAEQLGREDNADHGMCYVSGSKALAAREADAYQRGRAEVTAAVEAVLADAKPALSTDPLDCTNSCADGPCDCSGVNRVLAWELDKDAIRAALSDPDAALNRIKAETRAEERERIAAAFEGIFVADQILTGAEASSIVAAALVRSERGGDDRG